MGRKGRAGVHVRRAPAAAEIGEVAERSLELHLVADLQRLHELAELAAVRKARVLIAPVHLQICAQSSSKC